MLGPSQRNLGEAVGVLVLVRVRKLAVHDADRVLVRSLAQQRDDNPGDHPWRCLNGAFRLRDSLGQQRIRRADGNRIAALRSRRMSLQFEAEAGRTTRRELGRHTDKEFVGWVFGVGSGGIERAQPIQRVANQQVATHQAEAEQILLVAKR